MFIFLLVLGTVFTAAVVAAVLPRLVVYARAGGYAFRDRGIRKVNTPKGSLIVLEPAPEYRDTLLQFAVGRTGEGAVFVGKWAEHVRYAEYDLYVYNRRGGVMKVLSVRELPIDGTGSKIALPRDTGFVSPVLRAVNHSPRKARTGLVSFFRSLYIVLFLAGMLFWQTLYFEVCFSHLFHGGPLLPAGALGFVFSAVFLCAAALFAAVFFLFGARPLLSRFRSGREKNARRSLPRHSAPRSLAERALYAVRNFFTNLKTSAPALAIRKSYRRLKLTVKEFLRSLFRRKEGRA